MKDEKNKQYSLFTFIALIAGIIIGSGIYFKIGKITELSGGKISYVIINFSIAAIGVIFGGIAMSQFAIMSKGNGGVVTYFDEHVSRNSATGFAWYQTFAYYPVIAGVVSWVSCLYLLKLTHLIGPLMGGLMKNGVSEANAEKVLLLVALILGILMAGAFTLGNHLSKINGGRFQSISFVVKFLPVIAILIIAIVVAANPRLNKFADYDFSKLFDKPEKYNNITNNLNKFSQGVNFLGALPTVAFMYEGWIVATTVVNETKNRDKTVKLGYIIAPLIVFAFYIIYALTTNSILGGNGVAYSQQDVATNSIKAIVGGSKAASTVVDTLVLGIIIISVLGVVNGVTIGGVRLPQALAEKNMLPNKNNKLTDSNTRTGISKQSSLIFFISEVFAIVLFYIITITTGLDISDLTVQYSYLFYIILYFKLIIYTKQGKVKNKFIGYGCSTLGIFSSLLIFVGGFLASKQSPTAIMGIVIFGVIVFIVYLSGYYYSAENIKKEKKIIAETEPIKKMAEAEPIL